MVAEEVVVVCGSSKSCGISRNSDCIINSSLREVVVKANKEYQEDQEEEETKIKKKKQKKKKRRERERENEKKKEKRIKRRRRRRKKKWELKYSPRRRRKIGRKDNIKKRNRKALHK